MPEERTIIAPEKYIADLPKKALTTADLPCLQSGPSSTDRIISYTVKQCDYKWVRANIDRLSELHTNAMQRAPWHEEWSNNRDGQDRTTYSPALLEHHCNHRADFFAALLPGDGHIIGYGIGQHISAEYLKTLAWAQLSDLSSTRPQTGDYEMALVVVDPAFQRCGIASNLIRERLRHAVSTTAKGKRIWLQTLENAGINVIKKRYQQQGFQVVGRSRLKQTERIFMSCLVKGAGDLPR